MRRLLLVMLLLAPCLHARDCFGELDKYRWFPVESVADVDALPSDVKAVDARNADLATMQALEARKSIVAVRAPDAYREPELLLPLKSLPKLRVLEAMYRGKAADTIAQLTSVQVLISHGSIPGPDAVEMAKLAALTELHTVVFGGATATSEWDVSVATMRKLAAMRSLRRVDLSWTDFEDGAFAELAGLQDLEELELPCCTGMEGAWGVVLPKLSKLRRLLLGPTLDKDAPAFWRALPQLGALETLDLGDWHTLIDAAAAKSIAALPRLTTLRTIGARLDAAGLKRIGTCRELTHLVLSLSEEVLEDFSPLSGLAALEDVELHHSFACDEAIRVVAALPRLKRLCLFNGSADGSGFRAFPGNATLTRLEVIDMDALTQESLKLLVGLPGLRDLALIECTALEGKLMSVAGLKQLEGLSIECKNGLTPEEWQTLPKLESLKRLRIATQGADYPAGAGKWLAQCARLESLELPGWGEFPAEELPELKKLSGLKKLRVVLDKTTPEAVATLASMSGLEELAVGAVEAEGTDWMPLTKLPNLRELVVESWITKSIPQLRQAVKGKDIRVRSNND